MRELEHQPDFFSPSTAHLSIDIGTISTWVKVHFFLASLFIRRAVAALLLSKETCFPISRGETYWWWRHCQQFINDYIYFVTTTSVVFTGHHERSTKLFATRLCVSTGQTEAEQQLLVAEPPETMACCEAIFAQSPQYRRITWPTLSEKDLFPIRNHKRMNTFLWAAKRK